MSGLLNSIQIHLQMIWQRCSELLAANVEIRGLDRVFLDSPGIKAVNYRQLMKFVLIEI